MKKNTKQKVLTVMLAAAMVTSIGATGLTVNNLSTISVNAADTLTTEDGFSYEVIDNTNTVRITGYSKNGKIAIPSKIDGKTVVEIGSNAFRDKTGLQSVSIPETVKIIDGGAFSGCTGLQEVTMLNGLETIGRESFYNCTALKRIEIPDSVTIIDGHINYNGAFEGCTALETVIIGNSVKEIGSNAFQNCTSLSNLTLGNSVEKIGESVFQGCENLPNVNLPDSLTDIGDSAFYGCSKLNSITIPNKIKAINERTFYDCKNLQRVTMVNGLETIGRESFYNCTALKRIEIPDSVTIIDGHINYNGAFEGCTALETVIIGNSVKEIGSNAFQNCTSLSNLTLGNSVEKIGESVFQGCENLPDVTLPSSLTEMGNRVFSGCKKLETVVMKGENLVTIPSNAFSNCTSLKDVNIGAGITTIERSAFSNCTSLEIISIPNSVTTIESYKYYPGTFGNCTSLKRIIIPESVTEIGESTFNNHGKDLVIYGYSNDCEAKKYADANNITYKLINAHDHQPGEWITIKEATEKNSGTKIQKCTICEELLNVEIIDIIHAHTYGDKWQSDETNHWHECTVCGEKADTAKHEFGEWETDEKTAKQHRECTICGYTEEKAKPHEHSYGDDWYSDETNHWHECTVCGEKADTAEHEFGEWIIDEKTSTKHRECTVCEYPQSEIIPHIHTYGEEWKSDETNHWHECTICGDKSDTAKHDLKDVIDKEATATETGLKHKECTVCGYKGVSEVISKLDPTPTPTPPQPTPTPGKVVNTGDNAVPITIASVIGLGAVTAFVISYKKKRS